MIGKITIGRSFLGCISYNLEDKLELNEQEKIELSRQENVQHIQRAEVLYYNQCFGNKKELAKQFNQVARLNKKCEKPVLHFSFKAAPGEVLSKQQWIDLGLAVAREFKVEGNQYMIIQHHDSKQQHIHVIANRIGYDRKCASDSHSYKRVADICREAEKKLELKQVLSPRRFLSRDQRQLPRTDARKEGLKNDIREALISSNTLADFTYRMMEKKYEVIRGRGIAFLDNKKVYTKGSDIGYSLKTIENKLLQKEVLEFKYEQHKHHGHEADFSQALKTLMQSEKNYESVITEFERQLKQNQRRRGRGLRR